MIQTWHTSMSYRKIPQAVADKLRPLEVYVYLALASKSDYKTDESNVNEDTLAELTGLRRETISIYITKFDNEGIIKKTTERRKGDNGTFLFNHYYLIFVDDIEPCLRWMVKYKALGILLRQEPRHPDVASGTPRMKHGIMAPHI